MMDKTHKPLRWAIGSFALAIGILLALLLLVPLGSAQAKDTPSDFNTVRPSILAATAPYTTTTSISQIVNLEPGGTYMVGFAVEVHVLVTNIGDPAIGSPSGVVNVTTNNGGPACTNLAVAASGSAVSSATCTLFFTSANIYTISASFVASADWRASSAASSPVGVNPLSLTPDLSAGRLHTCALSASGVLECWGLSTSYPPAPQTLITNASAGGYQTCAINTDGSLSCWGDNSNITANVPSGPFLGIGTGKDHVCAIGTDYKLNCWGDPEALPITTTVGLSKPTEDVVAVSAGDEYDCAIRKSDSTLACWGDPDPAWNVNKPAGAVKAVAVGERHACAI